MEESKQHETNIDDDHGTNIKIVPAPFAPSDLSIEGFDDSLTSHRNQIILREKVVIVGDETVGKSSLVQSFVSSVTENMNNKHYLMTSGVDLNVKQVPIPNSNITVDLFLYDSGGQSVFNKREITSSCWKDCSYIICVFDISSRKTLQSCRTWIKAVRSSQQNDGSSISSMQAMLIANKIDLRDVSFHSNVI